MSQTGKKGDAPENLVRIAFGSGTKSGCAAYRCHLGGGGILAHGFAPPQAEALNFMLEGSQKYKIALISGRESEASPEALSGMPKLFSFSSASASAIQMVRRMFRQGFGVKRKRETNSRAKTK
jgi:hypothetical protein